MFVKCCLFKLATKVKSQGWKKKRFVYKKRGSERKKNFLFTSFFYDASE